MSTPPASARFRSPFARPVAPVATARRDDEQAPSIVYPPARKSKKLQIRPAMVLESPPDRESSLIEGKTDLKIVSKAVSTSIICSRDTPLKWQAAQNARRT